MLRKLVADADKYLAKNALKGLRGGQPLRFQASTTGDTGSIPEELDPAYCIVQP